jgi:hypothetical protein
MYGQRFPAQFLDFCCRFLAFVKIDGYCHSIRIVVLFPPRADSEAQLQLEHGSCPYLACPLANAFEILDLTLKSITSFACQGFVFSAYIAWTDEMVNTGDAIIAANVAMIL